MVTRGSLGGREGGARRRRCGISRGTYRGRGNGGKGRRRGLALQAKVWSGGCCRGCNAHCTCNSLVQLRLPGSGGRRRSKIAAAWLVPG